MTLEPAVASASEITKTLERAIPATTEQPAGNIFANVDEIFQQLCADWKIPFTVE